MTPSAAADSAPPVEPLAALLRTLRGGDRAWTAGAAARFDAWLDRLERDDDARTGVADSFLAILAATRHVGFHADLGIAPPDGFGPELRRRVLHKLLPADVDEGQLQDWARRLFGGPRESAWALSIPADRWRRLGGVLRVAALPPQARMRLGNELFEALKILSARIAAAGVDPLVARVYPDSQRSASPFLEQQPAVRLYVDAWIDAWNAGAARPDEDDRPIRVLLDQCRGVIRRIRRDASRTGVTVALTFKLQRAQEIIDRLEVLLDLADVRADATERGDAWIRFLRRQIRECSEENSVRAVWRKSTQLAALEMTEHAGRTGEHYIAADRSEWWAMLRAAMIGGLVIAFMAIVKVLIASMHAPPLVEGVLISLNYGLGFVLIHLVGGLVATKQPAMTAARIAAEIGEARAGLDARRADPQAWLPRVTELLVQVIRSQFVAVAGNVGVALPVAIGVTWGLIAASGWSPASPQKAELLLAQLDPLGPTLFYAAIAGVCLFLSGVISGYCDNLAIFHHLPRRVARMPLLVGVFGARRAAAFGAYVEHNFGALAGNFVFGCMLGGVTLLGVLTGLPLDIRHVAFASAHLGLAATTLWSQLAWQAVAVGALGVVLIAIVNLAVSFTLSLMLALRARRLDTRGIGALWGTLVRRAASRPLDLVRPPQQVARLPANAGD